MTASAQDESEYTTRRRRIDPLLKSQGWKVASFHPSGSLTDTSGQALTE